MTSEGQLWSALAALKAQGADRLDPVRFHHLEGLARRMQAQSPPVRRLLADKLRQGLAEVEQRQAADAAAVPAPLHRQPGTAETARTAGPLGELNRYIEAQAGEGADASLSHTRPPIGRPREMKSVRRFSEVWAKIAAEEQVSRALGRGPANAGPLNSHMLVLRTLTLMRELSPDYLRRFLTQVDALLWLDQLNQQHMLPDARPSARRGRPRK